MSLSCLKWTSIMHSRSRCKRITLRNAMRPTGRGLVEHKTRVHIQRVGSVGNIINLVTHSKNNQVKGDIEQIIKPAVTPESSTPRHAISCEWQEGHCDWGSPGHWLRIGAVPHWQRRQGVHRRHQGECRKRCSEGTLQGICCGGRDVSNLLAVSVALIGF